MRHQEKWKKKIIELKKEEAERFASELAQNQKIFEEDKKRYEYEEEFSKDLLKSSGVDIERIETYEKEQAERIAKEVEKERTELMGHRDLLADFHEKRAVAYEVTSSTDAMILPAYTGTLVATNEGLLAGISGEKDEDLNAITPYNPEDIRLRVSRSGSGTIFDTGPVYDPWLAYDLWYTFTPPETGTYQIRPTLDFHGFYILKAYDKIWNSKRAEVKLFIEIDAYQYHWIGRKKFWILDEKKTNGTENVRIDETKSFNHYFDLAAGDFTAVLVKIKIAAIAKGNGSYAEANFGSDTANFIRPLIMSAIHL